MEIKNAIIDDTIITNNDHGVLSIWLSVKDSTGVQGFGGYGLYDPVKGDRGTGLWLWRIMEIAGVSRWEELTGKVIRIKSDISRIYAIGHIINDDWFCPDEE